MVFEFVKNQFKDKAILFIRKNIDEDFIYLYPEKILIGKFLKNDSCFYDYYSDQLYYPKGKSEEDVVVLNINDIYKSLGKRIGIKKNATELLHTFKENILCLDLQEKELIIIEKEEFYEEFGFEPEDKYLSQMEEILNINEDIIDKESKQEKQINILDLKIDSIIEEIEKTVVSQSDAVKKIVTAIYKNYLFNDPEMKSNILVYGPTGVGKTEIMRQISKIIKLPVHIEDMTRYTPTGYKGSDLDNILAKLYINAGNNLELAQKSILILDEIDKKATGKDDKDFIKGDVLKSLLKIIEGGVFDIEVPGKGTINFDTSYLTIVAMGAFSELQQQDIKKNVVGFESGKFKEVTKEKSKEINIKDFVEFGFQPEFMGRFNTIVPLNKLEKEDLISILKNSSKSPIKKYEEALSKIGVDVDVLEELYDKIAQKASEKNTGARGLKLVTDEIFNDVLFQIFNEEEKNNLRINYDSLNTKKLSLKRKK